MSTVKVFTYFVLIIFVIVVFLFGRACENGFGYQAGSGLGSLADIENEKYKCEYLQQYADTFFSIYPQYKLPAGNSAETMIVGDNFMNLSAIYFDIFPGETYFVQWCGTGFISVRMAYNNQMRKPIVENVRADAIVADSTKERIAKRFRTEVLNKIDSIIAASKDSTNAIWVSPEE